MSRINYGPLAKSAFAVAPTPTTVDQFDATLIIEKAKLWVENLDGAQTMAVTIQTRPVKGSGNWAQTPVVIDPVQPNTAVGPLDLDLAQTGEMRIQLTASGAGLSCNYTRITVGDKWP